MFRGSSIPITLAMKIEHASNGNQVKIIFCVSLISMVMAFTAKEMIVTCTRVEGSENKENGQIYATGTGG